MNQVLEEILTTGSAVTSTGDVVQVHSQVSGEDARFLSQLTSELDIAVSLEIGLAFGVSALAICQSLKPGASHIVIDPFQNDSLWDGIGLANLNRAGLRNIVQFHEDSSAVVLPKLESRGVKIDFAFIDGDHSFDYVLVDFFHVDRLLRVGGVVVFDDADWRSVRKVLRFIVANLNYEVYRVMPAGGSWKFRLWKAALAVPAQIVKVARKFFNIDYVVGGLVGTDILGTDQTFGLSGGCVALRKRGPDTRRNGDFVPF